MKKTQCRHGLREAALEERGVQSEARGQHTAQPDSQGVHPGEVVLHRHFPSAEEGSAGRILRGSVREH